MAWQRKIPFGYMIRGGLIQTHPQEAGAVRYIFDQYLAGASLLTIAEDMTRQGIRYHQHTAEWNKHMVKRILENAKYIGEDNYPRLVSDEDFTAAQHRKAERNTYAPLPARIQPICNMVICTRCGGRMARGTRSYGRVSWRCQGPDCGQTVTVSDEALARQVEERLRELAQAPHLLTASEPERTEPDMEAIRLQNELNQAFNRGAEQPEYIKNLAFDLAVRWYGQLPDPTPAHELEHLRVRLEQGPADANTLADLLRTAVRAVRLTPEKQVELELINGTVIAEKEARSA